VHHSLRVYEILQDFHVNYQIYWAGYHKYWADFSQLLGGSMSVKYPETWTKVKR